MPRRPLTNARWGFTSNCFVCEPANSHGLRLPFFHDDEADAVVADFELGDEFSGAPSYVHGGVVLAVLDEAMAWAAIAIAGQWAVTRTTSTEFERPVRVDRAHQVQASIESTTEREIRAVASIVDAKGRTCATAAAAFTPLGEAQAIDAIGGAEGLDRSFLRGGDDGS
ncbi:MAG TPA: hotdog domain-containing protein [Acidimicrobiales bacterium]|nr:hotdog domain-containing protein [Acidimicrobiales bacterium]